MLMRYSLIMQLRLSGLYDALDLCSLTCLSVLALWSICIQFKDLQRKLTACGILEVHLSSSNLSL